VIFRREVVPVRPKNQKYALQSAINKLLEEKNAVDNGGVYVKTVLEAFDEIQSLITKGVRFDRICEAFKASGLLPENAGVHSFRQAFRRERKKRRENSSSSQKMDSGKAVPALEALPKPAADKSPGVEAAKNETRETEKERLKKMLGVEVDTGLGTIVKHADGTFEY
jgi:hypothetical protein